MFNRLNIHENIHHNEYPRKHVHKTEYPWTCSSYWISMHIAHVHHTEHLWTGFIFEEAGHCQALAKSWLLDRGPTTRNLSEKKKEYQ